MASQALTSDTLNTMLVPENNSLRSNDRRAASSPNGATSRFEEIPVTAAARRGLEQELAALREEQREIPARLRVAREFGDTANNDEHLAIREEEAVLAARIARLEDILMRATHVDGSESGDAVTIGATVTVVDVATGQTLHYVVGSAHGMRSPGTVSALSPIGQALLDRRANERVSVQLPNGRRREFELREVRWPR